MTHYILTVSNVLSKPISEVVYAISTFFSNLVAAGKRRAEIRNTIKELERLTDHELLDMGISRYDIERIAEDTARLAR